MFPNQAFPAHLFSPHLFARSIYSSVLSDTLTFTQSLTFSYVTNLNDTLTFTQSLSHAQHIDFNDTLTFTQTLFSSDVLNELLTDTLTFTQSVSVIKHVHELLSDTLTFTQSVSSDHAYTLSLSDTLTFTQSASTDFGLANRSLSDTLTFTQVLHTPHVYNEILPYTLPQTYQYIVQHESTLISYWKLNETSGTVAHDSKGSNPGTYTGTYTLNQSGAGFSGSGVLFDGSTGYVTFGTPVGLPVGSAAFAFEALFKIVGSTYYSCIVSYGAAVAQEFCELVITDDTDVALQFITNDLNSPTLSNSLNDGNWHHIVAQSDGLTTRSIYIDNVLICTDDPVNTFTGKFKNTGLANLRIGATTLSGNYFPGVISNVAIYNHQLSLGQIATHYNAIGIPDGADLVTFTETLSSNHAYEVGYGGPFSQALFPNIVFTHDIFSRTLHPAGTNVYPVVFTDILDLTDQLYSAKPVLTTYNLSDELEFFDYTNQVLGSGYVYKHDQILFTEEVIVTQPPKKFVSLHDKLIFVDNLHSQGSKHTLYLNDRLAFADDSYKKLFNGSDLPSSAISYPDSELSSHSYILNEYVVKATVSRLSNENYYQTLPYVTMKGSIDSIVLPAPLFGDEQQNVSKLIINRAIRGPIYTVVKHKGRNRLKWKFELERQKAEEFKIFLEVNIINKIMITDWKGNVWSVQQSNDPIITAISRQSNTCANYNEYHQIEVEFEGYLVSSQLVPCDQYEM